MASRQEEPEEYEEEYEEDFMNQVGEGVERVLFGVTWIFQAAFILFIVMVAFGLIFG